MNVFGEKSPLSAAAIAVVALVLISGCEDAATDRGGGESSRHHPDGEGPLSATTGGGGELIVQPQGARDRWAATFGVFPLCMDQGKGAVLERVAWAAQGSGAEVNAYVRQIPSAEDRVPDLDYSPTVARGTPSRDKSKLGGEFVAEVKGLEVTQPCDPPPAPSGGRQDLVLVVEAGTPGASVDEISLEYTSDGRRYAIDLEYKLVMCGSGIALAECAKP